ARVGLFDKPDDLLGAESALLHVRPLGFTDFIASAGTAQWGQVSGALCCMSEFLHVAAGAISSLCGAMRSAEVARAPRHTFKMR
ncbi:hypothetical protein WGE86_17090, partial [Xanthomonas euvesicatoria pv. euvesicatoria]|uniref:hypothetical protein n=1 Tax=Xanthomonas euvesicatoria TaxID=456327 RepID=UPI0032C1E19D